MLAIRTAVKLANHNLLEPHMGERIEQVRATVLKVTHKTSAKTPRPRETETHQISLDADSYEMRVDTGASHCISYDRRDFVGKITPS